MQSTPISSNEVLQVSGSLRTFVTLLSSDSPSVAESAATVLGRCCDTHESQDALIEAEAVSPLINLLEGSSHRSRQAAALAALAELTNGNPSSCDVVLQHEAVIPELVSFAKAAGHPRMKFTACVCLVHLRPHIIPVAAAGGAGASSSSFQGEAGGRLDSGVSLNNNKLSRDTVESAVLPVLVRLLSEPEVGADAAPELISLANGNASLQAAAVDADAISRLAALLKDSKVGDLGRCNALLALKMLTEHEENHRRQLVDCGALPLVASALTDASPAVRGAACCCMRSLSRSTRLLRCSLGSLTDVAAPLLELSRSEDVAVATEAAATLANMAVDYSSLKEQVLALQGITRFAELTGSIHRQMRLYGVWGLSSSVCSATSDVKAAVMKAVPWSTVDALLEDEEGEVKEKTLLLLRNLVNRERSSPPSAAAPVFEWSQGQLLTTVLKAIEELVQGTSQQQAKHLEQALYVVVNVASGGTSDKDAVIASGWVPVIHAALQHPNEHVREAAVWAVINISYLQEGDAAGTERRRGDLVRVGIVQRLRTRAADTSLNVRERAATALEQLVGSRGGEVQGGEGEIEGRIWVGGDMIDDAGIGDEDDLDLDDEDMEDQPEESLDDIEAVW